MTEYSTKRVTKELLNDLVVALKSIDSYGSVEIFVNDSTVTQITVRNIKKTGSNGISVKAKAKNGHAHENGISQYK